MRHRSKDAKKKSMTKRVSAIFKGSFLVGVVVFLIYLFYLGHNYLLASEHLRLKEIRITGNRVLSTEEIKGLLKLRPGENILKINLGSAVERLRVHPRVRKVSIKRVLPESIYIKIEERRAVSLVDYNGALYFADSDGVIIGRADKDVGARYTVPLPIIYGVNLKGIRIGDPKPPEGLKISLEVLGFISTLNNSDSEELSAVKIEFKTDGFFLYLKDYRIRVSRDGYREKWALLSDLLRDMELKGIWPRDIDLRFSDMIVVRPL